MYLLYAGMNQKIQPDKNRVPPSAEEWIEKMQNENIYLGSRVEIISGRNEGKQGTVEATKKTYCTQLVYCIDLDGQTETVYYTTDQIFLAVPDQLVLVCAKQLALMVKELRKVEARIIAIPNEIKSCVFRETVLDLRIEKMGHGAVARDLKKAIKRETAKIARLQKKVLKPSVLLAQIEAARIADSARVALLYLPPTKQVAYIPSALEYPIEREPLDCEWEAPR